MAHVQNTAYDKLLRHIRKKFHVSLLAIHPSKIIGRFAGHPILINSIPKAGTHMLEEVLNTVSQLRPRGDHTMSSWENADNNCSRKLRTLGRNQFALSHLPYFIEYNNAITSNDVRVIYLIRDPRDIICSFLNYVLHIDKTHMSHEYLSSINDKDEQITAAIEGGVPGIANLGDLLNKFSPWGEKDYCLTVRYEDFLENSMNTDHRMQVIKSVLEHIDINASNEAVMNAVASIDNKNSSTYNKGNSKQWKSLFNNYHKQLIKSYAGDWLIQNGYEDNLDW